MSEGGRESERRRTIINGIREIKFIQSVDELMIN